MSVSQNLNDAMEECFKMHGIAVFNRARNDFICRDCLHRVVLAQAQEEHNEANNCEVRLHQYARDVLLTLINAKQEDLK